MAKLANDIVKLHDTGKRRSGAIDRYTLLLLFPPRLQEKAGIRGYAIGCNAGHGQVIIADSTELPIGTAINTPDGFYAGKRVALSDAPYVLSSFARELIPLWQRYLQTWNDDDWTAIRRKLGK